MTRLPAKFKKNGREFEEITRDTPYILYRAWLIDWATEYDRKAYSMHFVIIRCSRDSEGNEQFPTDTSPEGRAWWIHSFEESLNAEQEALVHLLTLVRDILPLRETARAMKEKLIR